jgi:hydroxyacylglutathione hydrolase
MLSIICLPVTPIFQNARIFSVGDSPEAVVIDPGGEAARIRSTLEEKGLRCTQIWLTHSHLDHCGGVADLKNATGAKLYAHRDEAMFRSRVEEIATMYGIATGDMKNCPEPDVYLENGDSVEIAGVPFRVLFTPGHSPGHVCFYSAVHSVLFAGDTVFQGSIGRTDLPGGNHETLMTSIQQQILSLPGETRILSGHGEDTTVGAELRTNPFLRDFR